MHLLPARRAGARLRRPQLHGARPGVRRPDRARQQRHVPGHRGARRHGRRRLAHRPRRRPADRPGRCSPTCRPTSSPRCRSATPHCRPRLRRAPGGARWGHGVHPAGQHRSGGLADLPGLHELRRPGARRPPVVARRRSRAARSSEQALEAGINFFDTANVYSAGSSEEITGRALRDFARRDDIVIATKVHGRMRPGPNGAGLSRKAIMTEIDAQPAAARHRLRRPLPDPPLGPAHADRGDPRGAARRRQGGQGALPRRLLDVRVAVQQGAAPGRRSTAGTGSSRCRTTTTCSTARRSARCCRSAPTRASASSRGARWPAAG